MLLPFLQWRLVKSQSRGMHDYPSNTEWMKILLTFGASDRHNHSPLVRNKKSVLSRKADFEMVDFFYFWFSQRSIEVLTASHFGTVYKYYVCTCTRSCSCSHFSIDNPRSRILGSRIKLNSWEAVSGKFLFCLSVSIFYFSDFELFFFQMTGNLTNSHIIVSASYTILPDFSHVFLYPLPWATGTVWVLNCLDCSFPAVVLIV